MPGLMLRLLCCVLLAVCAGGVAHARTLKARVARVTTAVATLEGVRVRLDWSASAQQGVLHLQAQRVAAPELGYHFRNLDWRCPLQRSGQGAWHCDG